MTVEQLPGVHQESSHGTALSTGKVYCSRGYISPVYGVRLTRICAEFDVTMFRFGIVVDSFYSVNVPSVAASPHITHAVLASLGFVFTVFAVPSPSHGLLVLVSHHGIPSVVRDILGSIYVLAAQGSDLQ